MDEKIKNQIKDTIKHKEFMFVAGLKMFDFLESKDEKLAIDFIRRVVIHDNSKFEDEELLGLASIANRCALTNPNVLLSNEQENIVKIHWKNNSHHPEYYEDVMDMSELDIIEMCCDWYARSLQYNTDLMEFVTIRQENRFHFPKEMYEKILYYCNILLG